MSQNNDTLENLGGVQEPQMMGNGPLGAAGNPADGFIPPAGNQQQTAGSQGQQNAPDFISVVRKAASATAMSSEGTKYVKTLKEYVEDKGNGIKIIPLSYPYETMAFVKGKNAFTLVFSEANRKEENLPTASFTKAAGQTLQSVVGPDVSMRNCIIVTPQDYCKPEVMGAHLLNSFDAVSNSEIRGLDINSMTKFQLEIATNGQIYDDFIRRCDPMGVPARADLKLTVSLNVPRRKTSTYDIFSQADVDKMEIAAIGAYTIFVRTNDPATGGAKFIPEIHISNIVTAIPFAGLLPVILALATDTLIDGQYWKTQFSNLGGPNTPNIGTLINDPNTGAPWHASNITERDQFIQMYTLPPVLVLDVVEGRARVPGLELFALGTFRDANNHIVNMYNKFLGGNVIPQNSMPAVYIAQEYIGYFQSGASYNDSRWIDYLNMMIHHAQQKAQCDALCAHYNQPQDHLNIIRSLASDVSLHYVNHIVSLDPKIIRSTQQVVHQAIKTINGTQISGSVDVSLLLQNGQGFVQSPVNGWYQGNINANQFTQVYTNPAIFS